MACKPIIPSLLRRSSRVTLKVERDPSIFNEDPKPKRSKKSHEKPVKKEIFSDDKQGLTTCDDHQQQKLPLPDGFIEVDTDELDLERTLLGGQSFRWTKAQIGGFLAFTGVIQSNAFQLWRLDSDRVAFKLLNKSSAGPKLTKSILEEYFQLNYLLKDLYRDWSERDPHLSECCKQYKGFRILRQDPVENIFSFICATNNNIKRISQMVDKLCKRFGDKLESCDQDESAIDNCYCKFPRVERLAEDDVFNCLRYELGFGYRAKFIHSTALQMVESTKTNDFKTPRDYLSSFRKLAYKDTCKQLMTFPGIGRKVADCICLMSMDHLNSVPIDCHIYEIVCRDYVKTLRQDRKTLTESVHDMIGKYFNDLHGPLAGWATSILFIAELKHLKIEATKSKQ